MKSTLGIALFSITSLFTIGSASAQDHGIQATVPFNFTVAGQPLPANTYVITSERHGLLTIQSVDKQSAASAVTFNAAKRLASGSTLVFTRYGDQYFLHQVLSPSASINVDLPTSKLEKKVRLRQVSLTGGGTILVAMR